MSFAEKVRRAARPHETAGEVVHRLMPYGASLRESARHLERCGYRTPSGKLNWSAGQAYFEWMKFRVAKGLGARGRGEVAKRIEAAENEALLRVWGDEAAEARLFETWRLRDALGPRRKATTYPLRTKIKTAEDRARRAWWEASKSAISRGEAGPPEPLMDSRGRPLKGRRFSKIKRKPA
jgi:hypothetical protein